ncbi:MAG: stage II sporulation protein M [Candidatus Kapaibacteriales bacterium]
MTEGRFANTNRESWGQIAQDVQDERLEDGENTAKNYIKVNNDLSFARTFYPESGVSNYINSVAAKLHTAIHSNEITPWRDIAKFWRYYIPSASYTIRKYILSALIIFTLGVAIGFGTSEIDPDFPRAVMGDGYVNMTEENIRQDKPMDVYSSMESDYMFVAITTNNIRVSFLAFVAGMLFSIGSAIILLSNAVMLGSFHHIFYEYGILLESMKTVYVHGAFEISAIVVAGGAGMALGASFMFPGTYSRTRSFLRGAKSAASVIVGLLPVFMIAGFLESYVTRYTNMPDWLFAVIIFGSLIVFWWYFFAYPYKLKQKGKIEELAY